MKKKLINYTLVALAAFPLLFSCAKKDQNDTDAVTGTDEETVVMEAPTTKQAAVAITFSENQQPVYEDAAAKYQIREIEFTEDSRYIMERVVVATKLAVGDVETIVGKYSVSGSTYSMEGFGEVEVSSSSSVTVKPEGDSDNTATYTPEKVSNASTSNTDEDNLCRSWVVNNILLTVSGEGVQIEKSFTGCNIEEMAKYAANNGVSQLKDRLGELAGYNVNNIIFTGNKTFCVSFTNGFAVTANYSMLSSAQSGFTYSFENSDNPFFTGSGSASFTFPADGKLEIDLSATVEGYDGTLRMKLSKAN